MTILGTEILPGHIVGFIIAMMIGKIFHDETTKFTKKRRMKKRMFEEGVQLTMNEFGVSRERAMEIVSSGFFTNSQGIKLKLSQTIGIMSMWTHTEEGETD